MSYQLIYAQAQIFCVIILGCMLAFILRYEYGRQSALKWMYALTMLTACLDVVINHLPIAAPVAKIGIVLMVSLVGVICWLWTNYCAKRFNHTIAKRILFKVLTALPVAAVAVLVSLVASNESYTLILAWIYYFKLYIPVYLIYALVIWIMGIVAYFKTDLVYRKREFVFLMLLYAPVAVISAANVFLMPEGLSLFPFAVLISLTVLFARTLYKRSRTDNLTKLYNHSGLEDELHEQLKQYARNKDDLFYVVSCDMDGFKEINDRFTHSEGNRALQLVSDVLVRVAQEFNGEAFRQGGDEFMLILDTSDEVQAIAVKEALDEGFAAIDFRPDCKLCMSVGYELYDGSSDLEALLNRADVKMYEEKRKRKSEENPQ